MKTFDFLPADTLFFRDARPLSAGNSYGRGAQWPLPTVLHGALRAALLGLKGETPTVRHPGHDRVGKPRGSYASESFNWLNLRGPFPYDHRKGEVYFPIPRDLVPADRSESPAAERLHLIPPGGTGNLPKPLALLTASFAPPGKAALSQWVDGGFFRDYLAGISPLGHPAKLELWDSEHRTGVAINAETQTVADGQIYAAEHLRLRSDIALRFATSAPQANGHLRDGELEAFDRLSSATLQLGGEGRCGLLESRDAELSLPFVTISGLRVKWVLLTPAVFVGGWLPGWVDASTGSVKLRSKPAGFPRRDMRRKRRTAAGLTDEEKFSGREIDATLVAACTGKPQVVGGWDLTGPQPRRIENDVRLSPSPKPTLLAVPSGSVYYFETRTPDDAQALATALQGRCRSDFYGEKGLGLGVCGNWDEPGSGKSP